jgi:hypothetical protein
MSFPVVVAAKGIVIVVSIATVSCIGEENILVRIVANPLIAAFRFGQLRLFAAESASGFCDRFSATSGRFLRAILFCCHDILL